MIRLFRKKPDIPAKPRRRWRRRLLVFTVLLLALIGFAPTIIANTALRNWVDDPASEAGDLEAVAAPDEQKWRTETADLLLY